MARIRTIKPETLSDPKAARLSDGAWRLWIGMWTLADDAGRLPADPDWLHGQVFWARPCDMEPLVKELTTSGHVRFYEANGERFAVVKNFNKHQKIDKPQPPKYPAPPDDSESIRDDSRTFANARGGIGREGKGEEENVLARECSRSERLKPSDLQGYWLEVFGNIEHNLLAVANLIEDYAKVHASPDMGQAMRLAVSSFSAWRDDCPPNRRPAPSPAKFIEHWSAIQDVMNGKRKTKVGASSAVEKLTQAAKRAAGDA